VAAVLNIEPNHLDRHPDFNSYFQAKMNIFKNQKHTDYAVLPQNSSLRPLMEKQIKAQAIYFSDELINENQSCVYRIAAIFGLSKADCLKIFSSFTGLPHRLQKVREINKVTFVNDSKSTNPASTVWALKNLSGPVILIAGGKDKGVAYTSIIPYLKKVKKINLIGAAAQKIKNELCSYVPIEIFSSLAAVVQASFSQAQSQDTVLFSPMCASFDMFLNYMDRGKKYTALVKQLGDSDN
jgi:UDP-N-acetylmuramoylalanine--D-glutamate ligase